MNVALTTQLLAEKGHLTCEEFQLARELDETFQQIRLLPQKKDEPKDCRGRFTV